MAGMLSSLLRLSAVLRSRGRPVIAKDSKSLEKQVSEMASKYEMGEARTSAVWKSGKASTFSL